MAEGSESDYASQAEIRSAIDALGTDKLKALHWGRTLLWTYGKFAEGREPEDLYQEALKRTWDGTRKWKPKNCNILEHVMGVMRSIASHLPEKYGNNPHNMPLRDSDSAQAEGRDAFADVTQAVASDDPTPEEAYAVAEGLNRIEELVKDDKEASDVLAGLRLGMTEKAISEEMNLPVKRVHAAVARIRYKVSSGAR